ncbi:N-acetylglucosamine kinase [Plantibacter sp. YIM 135347]|uniref:N-acetylglucosamine kinase n=1 Tax=Plantibacter sp. YIM 135347 TaxID=3423919 RepID=UPI003D34D6C3
MPTDGYVVGVDAGGSKTHLRTADLDGGTLEDVVVPSRGWTSLDAEGKAAVIVDLLAASRHPDPIAIAVGAHGCDSDEECEDLRVAIAARVDPPVVVVNDALLLQHAADEHRSANLVLGTGSIIVAMTEDGRTLYAGGWGWLIGDPGSAWGMVRDSVRRLADDADAGRPDDELLAALRRQTGLGSLRAIVDRMQRTSASEWAAWAPVVFDAASHGSAAALAAVDDSADRTVELVRHLIDRGAIVDNVVAGGGVITHQAVLEMAIAHRLSTELGLAFTVVREAPVVGAVQLATSMLEVDPSRD